MGRTRAEQRTEVEAWRASGLAMAKFARVRGYSRSSLEKWARALREEQSGEELKFVRLEVAHRCAPLVLEIGAARIRLERGFDAELLRELVEALGARA